MSSKLTWTFERSTPDELRDPFREHHYKGEHAFMKDHCFAAVHKATGQKIAFVGTSSNSHEGQRLLWLLVLPQYDGYGIGLKMARLAASVLLEAGFNRVSFITEKETLSPLLLASGWVFDRRCAPSPNVGESEATRRARLSVLQYRFYMTAAPEPAHISMQVTSHYGIIFGDSCVKSSQRGRRRKHADEQTRWRLAKRAQRQRETTSEAT